MDASAAPGTGSAMDILDLPDNCLQEIFANLRQVDLVAVADVCQRFRSISQAFSGKFKIVCLNAGRSVEKCRLFLNTLRNFGASIETISLWPGLPLFGKDRQIMEYVHRYCNETLIEMWLGQFELSAMDEGHTPIFHCVQRLGLSFCTLRESFLKTLPVLFPSLQALYLQQNSYKGKTLRVDLSFVGLLNLVCWRDGIWIDDILKSNPQLKKIQILDRYNDSIFDSFAKYVPQLENIRLSGFEITRSWIRCFGQLRNLRTLRLEETTKGTALLIKEIAAQNIPIENLCLISNFCDDDGDQQLINEICKCQTLKMLEIGGAKSWLNTSHIRQIYERLGELTELQLHNNNHVSLTTNVLLCLVRNLKKLQLLRYDNSRQMAGKINTIDLNTFTEIVQIVAKREKKSHLKIVLNSCSFIANVPEHLAKLYEGTLKMVLRKEIQFSPDFEW